MKIADILELATVKTLLFVVEKGEVRYSDLSKLIRSRGTLSLCIKELEEETLLKRRIVVSRPIQSYYSLTKKGKRIGAELRKLGAYLAET